MTTPEQQELIAKLEGSQDIVKEPAEAAEIVPVKEGEEGEIVDKQMVEHDGVVSENVREGEDEKVRQKE